MGDLIFAGHRESLQAMQLWVERTELSYNSECIESLDT